VVRTGFDLREQLIHELVGVAVGRIAPDLPGPRLGETVVVPGEIRGSSNLLLRYLAARWVDVESAHDLPRAVEVGRRRVPFDLPSQVTAPQILCGRQQRQRLVDGQIRTLGSYLVGVLCQPHVLLSLSLAEAQIGLDPGQPAAMSDTGFGSRSSWPHSMACAMADWAAVRAA
jgi:hypothetical protein